MTDKIYCVEPNFVAEYQPGFDARVELRNGRFLDVVNGSYFEPGVSVIVEGGNIKGMPGLPGEPRNMIPDFTIDLKGKVVLPGLFNTHCHVNMTSPSQLPDIQTVRMSHRYHEQQMAKNMTECLVHGITNIRDAWEDDLRPVRKLRGRIARREIPGPRILQAVAVTQPKGYLSQRVTLKFLLARYILGIPLVDYDSDYCGVVVFPKEANQSQVREAVNKAVDERGADLIKIGEQLENMTNFKLNATIMTIKQMEALTDQARRRGVQTTMHHVSVESFRRGVKSGVSSLAHIPADGYLTQEDIEAFKAADGIIEPTLSVAYDVCWKIKGDPQYDHPDMNRLTEFRDDIWATLAHEYWIPELSGCVIKTSERLKSDRLKVMGVVDMSVLFRYYSSMISYGVENCRMLYGQGVCMACGNDGGIPPCTPAMVGNEIDMFGLFLNKEAADGEQFSGADAVRVATINSARAMGLEKSFGSIETGKVADLAIVDGDPLEDSHVLGSRVAALFMDGRLIIDNCGLQLEPVRKA